MDLSEFQAWFDDYTEEMKGPPSKEQWAKIKKRVAEITPDPTPAPIFIERYVRLWRPYWDRRDYSLWSKGEQNIKMPARAWLGAGRAEYRASL